MPPDPRRLPPPRLQAPGRARAGDAIGPRRHPAHAIPNNAPPNNAPPNNTPPNNAPPNAPTRPAGPEEGVDVEERQKTAVPKRFRVIFHNDDYTTMEYVIEVLRRFFHKTETEALHIMLTVHKKGKAIAGIYPRDVAETKVAEVMRDARDRGHPLLLTTEPD